MYCHCDARHTVTFPTAQHHRSFLTQHQKYQIVVRLEVDSDCSLRLTAFSRYVTIKNLLWI